MLPTIFLLVQLGFAVLIFFLALAFMTGAPYVPSSKHTAQKMIDLAQLKPGMKVYDLGSGDGRLLFLAAKRGAKANGFEINPFLVLLTSIKIALFKRTNLERLVLAKRGIVNVWWKNFWTADLSDAYGNTTFVTLVTNACGYQSKTSFSHTNASAMFQRPREL